MYNACFDFFPWPPIVNGFAADLESFAIVPRLLRKTCHAVGGRVEVRRSNSNSRLQILVDAGADVNAEDLRRSS